MKTASCRLGMPLVALLVSSLPLLPGCAVESASEPPEERVAQADETIVGGNVEPGFDAVVALIDTAGGACTGTIIAKNGSTGYVLTAAHCTGMDYVIQADNYNDCFQGGNQANCQAAYDVVEQIFHPSYNDADPSQGYDFSLIRFSGANASTPVIPAAAPSDGVAVGTNLLAVGYGITSANNNGNSLRRSVGFSVADLNSILIVDDQTDGKGSCSGDSGGPAILSQQT